MRGTRGGLRGSIVSGGRSSGGAPPFLLSSHGLWAALKPAHSRDGVTGDGMPLLWVWREEREAPQRPLGALKRACGWFSTSLRRFVSAIVRSLQHVTHAVHDSQGTQTACGGGLKQAPFPPAAANRLLC